MFLLCFLFALRRIYHILATKIFKRHLPSFVSARKLTVAGSSAPRVCCTLLVHASRVLAVLQPNRQRLRAHCVGDAVMALRLLTCFVLLMPASIGSGDRSELSPLSPRKHWLAGVSSTDPERAPLSPPRSQGSSQNLNLSFGSPGLESGGPLDDSLPQPLDDSQPSQVSLPGLLCCCAAAAEAW